MNLTDRTHFPPHGYLYREPGLWECPRELAMLGLYSVARALQIVRIQNPTSGLDPSYEACVEAIALYTCTRLNNDPKYCGDPNSPPAKAQARGHSKPRKCPGCGRR